MSSGKRRKLSGKPKPRKNKLWRPKVPPETKELLRAAAGYKCANPGCPNRLVELHHIREWAVYRTHDKEHMIAICPTCHAHVDRGSLTIDEPTIRSWKAIRRESSTLGHVYVEPGGRCRVRLGSIDMVSADSRPDPVVVFRLSPNNEAGFRVADREILQLNLRLADTQGRDLVRVVDGHLRHAPDPPVTYESRPGRHRITAPATPDYLPAWVLERYTRDQRNDSPHLLVEGGRFTALDIEVLDRGLVQVQGVWVEGDRAVVAGPAMLSLHLPSCGGFIHCGSYPGPGSAIFEFQGPIEYSFFQVMLNQSKSPAGATP
jgi:hypothetical protein